MNAPVPDRSEHEAESSLMEHLLELRTRLIRAWPAWRWCW